MSLSTKTFLYYFPVMARSSADQTLLPNEHGHILCEDRNRPVSVLPAGHGSDDYLHNPSVLHQLQAERKLGDEEGTNTTCIMS